MNEHDGVVASPAVALAFAEALEQALGEDALLTVGISRSSITQMLGDEPVRVASTSFGADDGAEGMVALVALPDFAAVLENCAADEMLLTACAPALAAAAKAIGTAIGTEVRPARAFESDLQSVVGAYGEDQTALFVLLDGTTAVGCLMIGFAAAGSSSAVPTSRPGETGAAPPAEIDLNAPVALDDVRMAVTAELGRVRMTARELLSLQSGAVFDLDRSVGEPVDILVNGTPIARGQVVVIDDEFGVRISELLVQDTPSR